MMGMDEFITATLAFVVGSATTVALYLGLLGMLGAARLVRCAQCDHWALSHTDSAIVCARCSHPALWHPLAALRRRRGHRNPDIAARSAHLEPPAFGVDTGLAPIEDQLGRYRR
ncbi:hypothetical protein BKG75_16225 [Mycobacteroides chelonae]|uniref:hypothetical protein n=2 Tax=Mycobacteroides chelonae TaxID=1774 RepID=UPI0008A86523|nr:hypothetical protein DYE20_04600 [[Mycobacterium] chelonae subsp. gwanakae]OHU16502.1 hypothetical protein BKG75_16225 [Mycobacteroides chelonae]